jgi:acetyl esterase/lipase
MRVAQGWRKTRPPPAVKGLIIRDETIAGVDGASIRVRLYLPAADQGARAALLWIHGGGMIVGKPEQDERRSIELCRRLGLVIAAIDYRLSPEHPYPAPLDDCYAAFAWLHSKTGGLNISPDRIAVGGNSAGAGLAAGLALLAHDRNEYAIAFQLLIYPMLDDRTTLRTDIDERRLRLWSTKSNRFGWCSYLGREPGSDDVPDYAAPARRKDLSGLPPAWIGVGTCDLFHDEDVDYARRLKDAGIPCTLDIVPGAFHGFDLIASQSEVGRNFRQNYFGALRSALSC